MNIIIVFLLYQNALCLVMFSYVDDGGWPSKCLWRINKLYFYIFCTCKCCLFKEGAWDWV